MLRNVVLSFFLVMLGVILFQAFTGSASELAPWTILAWFVVFVVLERRRV